MHASAKIVNKTSFKPVFQLEAEGVELLGVLDPGALHHPDGVGRTLAANHKKHRPSGFVKSVVDKESLLPSPQIGRVKVVQRLLEPLCGGRDGWRGGVAKGRRTKRVASSQTADF